MSLQAQIKYKLALINKLSNYLLEHNDVSRNFPKNFHFIVQSKKLDKLDKDNDLLVKELLSKGEGVVVAEEKASKIKPWSFQIITS